MNDKVMDKLVDELMRYRAPVYKSKRSVAGKVSTLDSSKISGFVGAVQGMVRCIVQTWSEAQQYHAGGLHVCPRGGRNGTFNPLGCECSCSVVREDRRHARGGPVDEPALPTDGHEGADEEAGAEGTSYPAGAPLVRMLHCTAGDIGGGRSCAL